MEQLNRRRQDNVIEMLNIFMEIDWLLEECGFYFS